MHIKYVQHSEINKEKWDACVAQSANGTIFCQSVYLDSLCQWDALVADDYNMIMPLPFKKKWGIAYIYHPYFTGQLGIIAKQDIHCNVVMAFIAAIPKKFKIVELDFNEANPLVSVKSAHCFLRSNFILPLDIPYHLIEKNYSKDAQKNLRRAQHHQLLVKENINPQLVIQFFKAAYGNLNEGISEDCYSRFAALCQLAVSRNLGFTMGIADENGHLLATAFWGMDTRRIYYICGAPSARGRALHAQHVLIDAVIKKFAGSGLLLDFEGSDIESVAVFYKKFAPQNRPYMHVSINRLPIPLRWLKKIKP